MIWLLESILRRLPQGMHDWSKFIKLEEMYSIMQESGFREILIKGFDMTGGTSFETLKKLLFNTLTNQTITNNSVPFEIFINDDTSVWYIGKAVNA
jgi:2-polyprenyl-6-hydroxyphenyl methylase/3-demethylubiquinone-9 3-methyltransferase